jgi:hypothetical protein
MQKFADYPVVMLDIYGRERHPEASAEGEDLVLETYAERRHRAELMLYTLEKVPNGIQADNRFILIDEDQDQRIWNTSTGSSRVTHLVGGAPQSGMIVDLNGRVIHFSNWENAAKIDEVLSNVFGLEPGLGN